MTKQTAIRKKMSSPKRIKSIKKRSYLWLAMLGAGWLICWILSMVFRLFLWVFWRLRKSPIYTSGFLLLLVSFCFVGLNALFLQKENCRKFFFEDRPIARFYKVITGYSGADSAVKEDRIATLIGVHAYAPVIVQKGQKQAGRADIVRVQQGLRTFGDRTVSLNGIEDEATQTALRRFQKMFNLPVDGRVQASVLDKMREIGLLS
ncbi:peptidoglycan-binding domain-containing protein [Bartonella sp. DGB2]|uniref:peptidoglycan-binding domain-containing protein n=1 Tax=Bartonella sp. DGB2 TaxID=3388426 RepID=UPI00399038A2